MKYPLIAKNTIKIGKETIPPGATFDAGSKKEMGFYLSVGAAELPRQKPEETSVGRGKQPTAAELEKELIEQIKATKTRDELDQLMAGNEKNKAACEAASERLRQIVQEEMSQ